MADSTPPPPTPPQSAAAPRPAATPQPPKSTVQTVCETVVDCLALALIGDALLRGKFTSDATQAAALVVLALLAGVRAADLGAFSGRGGGPGAGGLTGLLVASIAALTSHSSSGRARADVLAACLVTLGLAALALPVALALALAPTGGLR